MSIANITNLMMYELVMKVPPIGFIRDLSRALSVKEREVMLCAKSLEMNGDVILTLGDAGIVIMLSGKGVLAGRAIQREVDDRYVDFRGRFISMLRECGISKGRYLHPNVLGYYLIKSKFRSVRASTAQAKQPAAMGKGCFEPPTSNPQSSLWPQPKRGLL